MAKRFQFRLEQVLNLRKQVEEVRVRELAQAKGQLLKIEEAIKDHLGEESQFLEMYGEFEKNPGFNADEVMAYCDYKDWLLKREKEFRRREKEWIKEVERRRQEAVKVSRERQLLENLRKKQKRSYDQEVLGEEQRFLDEISSIAFVRRSRAQKAMGADLTHHLGR
jgi:flagellar protein FliJ